jgi:adenosylmethionine-8-amino-7-oxononanoate aminotransferase
VTENEPIFRRTLEQLLDLEIVGDVRGAGYLWSLELVKDKETRATFSEEESEWLLRGFLTHRLIDEGLLCRTDDRGDPVIQLSPPLIAGPAEFDEIVRILGEALTEAQAELRSRGVTEKGQG